MVLIAGFERQFQISQLPSLGTEIAEYHATNIHRISRVVRTRIHINIQPPLIGQRHKNSVRVVRYRRQVRKVEESASRVSARRIGAEVARRTGLHRNKIDQHRRRGAWNTTITSAATLPGRNSTRNLIGLGRTAIKRPNKSPDRSLRAATIKRRARSHSREPSSDIVRRRNETNHNNPQMRSPISRDSVYVDRSVSVERDPRHRSVVHPDRRKRSRMKNRRRISRACGHEPSPGRTDRHHVRDHTRRRIRNPTISIAAALSSRNHTRHINQRNHID